MPESWDRDKSLERQIRAFHWVRMLAELPDRFAGTREEREAAHRVESWIRDLGVDEVVLSPVSSRPRPGWVLALHMGLGALACGLGGGLGAVLALAVAWSFRRELRSGKAGLTRPISAPDSLNVVARAGSRSPTQRVVLSAQIDTAQAGWLFSPAVADVFARWTWRESGAPQRPHALTEWLLFTGAVVAWASWLGADGIGVGAVRLALGVLLAVGAAVSLQWARARPTPGANDNASAVAAMLTCAERVLAELSDDAELWIVGTGAEEVGCCGMKAFVAEHADWPLDSSFFINFECVGGSTLHWVRSEGTLNRVAYPPTLLELARRVAASGVFGTVTPVDLMAGTGGSVPAARHHPSLSIISLEPNGVPRHYHRPEDVPEFLDMYRVVRAADFGAAVAGAVLRGGSGPIAVL
jgi:hypothetical protein